MARYRRENGKREEKTWVHLGSSKFSICVREMEGSCARIKAAATCIGRGIWQQTDERMGIGREASDFCCRKGGIYSPCGTGGRRHGR